MLKAGALFYSVVISLVIAFISGSIILVSTLSFSAFRISQLRLNLERNATSGLNLLLSEQELVGEEEDLTIDLYGLGTDSVQLSRKFWGAFEIAVSKASKNGILAVKIAETGFAPGSINSYSIYVSDQDKPVAVCGNTKIRGRAFLPSSGIKRAYIEGQNYTGNSLIYGEIRTSKKNLPAFNKKLLERIRLLSKNDSASTIASIEESVDNSFQNPLLVISLASPAYLRHSFSGHIVIASKTMIVVESEADLRDVILLAPKIIIKSGFNGNLQAFASDSILVEEHVALKYPSVLGIVQDINSKKNTAIVLCENDTICGSIFSYTNDPYLGTNPGGITIPEKCIVYGNIYSNGYADTRGTIIGSLMCRNIILHTSSSVYENHILNAVIDRNALSEYYTGINLLEEPGLKRVVKWLK
jgi:hypothetical protein